MLKNVVLGITICAMAVFFAGCASTKISQPSAPIQAAVVKDLKPNLTVGQKIEGKAKVQVLFGLFTWGADKFAEGVSYGGASANGGIFGPGPEAMAKSAAVYNAVAKDGSDVIVSPKYKLDVQDYFVYKVITADVSGFSGTVSSIN